MKADVILESTTVVVVVNLTELFNLFQGLGSLTWNALLYRFIQPATGIECSAQLDSRLKTGRVLMSGKN